MPRYDAQLLSALGMANEGEGPGDPELLRRFAVEHDAAAFELLVWRHSALVLRVCRSILHDRHEAEDAAQAAFLALARQARSIREANISGWLFQVARRISLRSARQLRKQPATGNLDFDQLAKPARPDRPDSHLERILHEELLRLPEKYQLPLLLCFFEGHTFAEAARRLEWPLGTVAGRVSRAKRLLEGRLVRRGVSLAGVAISAGAISPSFARAAARAAIAFATGHVSGLPRTVLELANREVAGMLTMKALRGVSVLVFGAAAISFGWASEPAPTPAPACDAQPLTAKPKVQTIRREVTQQPGIVEPFEEVAVYPKIAGFVEEVKVDIGDKVKKGELLVKIWAPEIEADLRNKEERWSISRLILLRAKAAASLAEDRLRLRDDEVKKLSDELKLFQSECDVLKEAVKNGRIKDQETQVEVINRISLSEVQVSKTKTKLEAAQDLHVKETAFRDKALADVPELEASAAIRKREYEEQLNWFNHTQIMAPCDGVVTRRNVHTGHFVQPSNWGGARKAPEPLLVIARTDRVRVVLTISEPSAFFVKEGAEAIVRLPALENHEIAGKVERLSWMLGGRTQPELRVEIFLDNAKSELRPSMLATVSIFERVSESMTLPADAILTDGAGNHCYLVENGKATRRNVKVGSARDGQVEVLAKQVPSARRGEGTWVKFTGAERAILFDLRSIEEGEKR